MSKNKNLHDVVTDDNGNVSVGNYIDVVLSGNVSKSRHKLYFATCKDCGAVIEKDMSDLRRMSLKCNHKNGNHGCHRSLVAGVGINDMPVGWIAYSKYNTRSYDLWKAMLLRTTEKFWNKYPTYTGATVSEDWKILSVFLNDIEQLEGYELWKNCGDNEYMLDKDTIILGNKHYSKETCKFISHVDSNKDVAKRHPNTIRKANKAMVKKYSVPIKATNIKTKEIIIFNSKSEAARSLNIKKSNIWMILSKDKKYESNKSSKGWTFSFLDDD